MIRMTSEKSLIKGVQNVLQKSSNTLSDTADASSIQDMNRLAVLQVYKLLPTTPVEALTIYLPTNALVQFLSSNEGTLS